jgi:Cu2+-exporting ATPase
MIPNNPLLKILDTQTWVGTAGFITSRCFFFAMLDIFVRAWKSI